MPGFYEVDLKGRKPYVPLGQERKAFEAHDERRERPRTSICGSLRLRTVSCPILSYRSCAAPMALALVPGGEVG